MPHRRGGSLPEAAESRSTKMGAMMTSAVNSLVNFEELKPMRAWWKLLMKVRLQTRTLSLSLSLSLPLPLTLPPITPTPNPLIY
jgi:hypothetical protein